MTSIRPLLRYQFPACAEQMGSVRQKLREALLGCCRLQNDINNVVLAVGEACMNIIQHAYGPHDRGDIVLEVDWEMPESGENGGQLVFRLTDFAKLKTCAEQMKSRPLDEIRPGGLGCFIMQEVMDEVKLIECEKPCGNVLQMRKKLRA